MFIGHNREVSFLNRIVKGGHVDHAYIFSGPENIGKYLLAKIFARSMIEGIKELKLNSCDFVQFLPDLLLLEPEVERVKGVLKEKLISVEKIREVEKNLSLYPYSGKYKILLINNAHRMSVQSQNALLKTLEEPNPNSIIILVTHQIEAILPTIYSRCQVLKFGRVSSSQIRKEIADLSELGDKLAVLGKPGLVVNVCQNEEIRHQYEEAVKVLRQLSSMNINERFNLADSMSKNTTESISTLELWSWLIHEKAIDNIKLFKVINKINNTLKQIKTSNSNVKLALENLFLEL